MSIDLFIHEVQRILNCWEIISIRFLCEDQIKVSGQCSGTKESKFFHSELEV